MVPGPSRVHQRIERRFMRALESIAARRHLEAFVELDLHDPSPAASDFRQPDHAIAASADVSERGIEGKAQLIVEIVSPKGDESYDKLPFYARVGVQEMWLVDPKRRHLAVHVSKHGVPVEVEAVNGRFHSAVLELELWLDEDVLRIRDGEHEHAVDLRDQPDP